jgi:hypothetical protein
VDGSITAVLPGRCRTRSGLGFQSGRLDAAPEESYYRFRYTGGALSAERETGMKPLVAFPDFHRQYESPELFLLFKNRVISPSRKDFAEYLGWLDLDANHTMGQSMHHHSDNARILALNHGAWARRSLGMLNWERKSSGIRFWGKTG